MGFWSRLFGSKASRIDAKLEKFEQNMANMKKPMEGSKEYYMAMEIETMAKSIRLAAQEGRRDIHDTMPNRIDELMETIERELSHSDDAPELIDRLTILWKMLTVTLKG